MHPLIDAMVTSSGSETARVLEIVRLTLVISGMSTLISSLIGIPLGVYLGMRRGGFPLLFRTFTHALYGMPPVLAGLLMYLLLSKSGPLGELGILFTPAAMVAAQVFLITPLIIGITASAVDSLDPAVLDTARTLGARGWDLMATLVSEARTGMLTAVMVGFGRAVSEVGAVIIVGGNIKWRTQVLTTAIVIETERGNIQFAIILGAILLTLAVVAGAALTFVQVRSSGGASHRFRRGWKDEG